MQYQTSANDELRSEVPTGRGVTRVSPIFVIVFEFKALYPQNRILDTNEFVFGEEQWEREQKICELRR